MTNTTLTKKEKDTLRKQQHSEIEKKRRLRINNRFEELRELVSKDTNNVSAKPTDFKLQVLDQTVDYINNLKSEILGLKGAKGESKEAKEPAPKERPPLHAQTEAVTQSTRPEASSSSAHKVRTITPPQQPPQSDETIVADVLVSLSTPESPFTKLGMSSNKIPEDLTLPPPM